jgi:hypothetical protein
MQVKFSVLKDIVIKTINEFQKDCLELCKNHYPTVHNKGMSEHHLARTFIRRIETNFTHFKIENRVHPLETSEAFEHPAQFRISTAEGTIWLLSQHLLSANQNHRRRLFAEITNWHQEYSFAIQPNDFLVVLCDHWFTKSVSSRELLSWWHGDLPIESKLYSQAGINLLPSDTSFVQALDSQFGIAPCFITHGHPLLSNQARTKVFKYVQLYAIFEWQ